MSLTRLCHYCNESSPKSDFNEFALGLVWSQKRAVINPIIDFARVHSIEKRINSLCLMILEQLTVVNGLSVFSGHERGIQYEDTPLFCR